MTHQILFELMPEEAKTSSAVAILLVETKGGNGHITLPGAKPFALAEYPQEKNTTVPGHVVINKGDTIRIGRDITNELALDIPNVSRFHALILGTASGVRLTDLSSTNGTFVNSHPISTPVKIETGDIVEIGPATLKVELFSDLLTQTNLAMVGTEFDPISTTGIVTVLVADVCSYTKMSEVLPPQDMTKMLQLWFELMSNIITESGGKIDKYIGDAVMAFWRGTDMNAPILAIEATKAAVKIKEETLALSAGPHWNHAEAYDWDCRISLNTGQVMIGTIGGRGSRNHTVLGDVVNVAFRLITVAGNRGYDFVIGNKTAEHIQNAFEVVKLGPLQVKGRSQPVVAYTLS